MFASPVVYSSSLVPESLRLVFGLNPMTGVIEGFRWALLGSGTPSAMVLVSVGMVVVLLISGMFYFRRMEQYYADIV
jgi:lipopolysaccharide transport system permease protein